MSVWETTQRSFWRRCFSLVIPKSLSVWFVWCLSAPKLSLETVLQNAFSALWSVCWRVLMVQGVHYWWGRRITSSCSSSQAPSGCRTRPAPDVQDVGAVWPVHGQTVGVDAAPNVILHQEFAWIGTNATSFLVSPNAQAYMISQQSRSIRSCNHWDDLIAHRRKVCYIEQNFEQKIMLTIVTIGPYT